MKKSKEELSKIANKAVKTRKMNVAARQMLNPLLKLIIDKKSYHLDDLELFLAEELEISEKQLLETIPSGQKRFRYRMDWTKSFLKSAKLIDVLSGAKFRISDFGLMFLQKNPNFTIKDFDKIPAWNKKYGKKKSKIIYSPNLYSDPEKEGIKLELLKNVRDVSPYFFEKLVLILLQKMEYGSGKVTKKSHDGGIDGIISTDKLGLDDLYMQAKRYAGAVSLPDIQKFIGAIQTTKTKRGVFITSGSFSDTAHNYILKSGLNIQLIDGDKLSDLMYTYNVGLKVFPQPELKVIDEGFFVGADDVINI